MNHLIINADDFGLAEEVNEAVEKAHRYGILSSASLMVSAPAARDAVLRARAIRTLRVGLHLVLVDGVPMLPPEQIPALVDGRGRLRGDLTGLAMEIAVRPTVRSQLRAETRAQFEAFRQANLPLDHVNAHKHFHLHPIVAQEIMEVGAEFGMRALRVPDERRGILVRSKQGRASAATLFLIPWVALMRERARRRNLHVPDAVFGLTWSGAFTTDRMIDLLRNLPEGLIEVYMHPATADRFPGCMPGYRYTEELRALCSDGAAIALRESGFRLGSYSDAPAHFELS